MNLIELCQKFIAIDSSLSHGTRAIAEYSAQVAQNMGLQAEIFPENYNGIENSNVIISHSSASTPKQLLLVSRLDTPEPGEYAKWIKNGANPFNASINGDQIYGLGMADAKADFVCKLAAMVSTKSLTPKDCRPLLVGTFGGSSGNGAIKLIRKKRFQVSKALVGAPTKLKLAYKGPGFAQVEIGIKFSEVEKKYLHQHSLTEGSLSQSKIFHRAKGQSEWGDQLTNPIFNLLDYLKKLPKNTMVISAEGGASPENPPDIAYLELDFVEVGSENVIKKLTHVSEALKEFTSELKAVIDEDCNPAHSTINLGRIQTLPEEIKLTGICRLIPTKGRELYESWLQKLRERCAEVGATFQIIDYKPPFEGNSKSTFIQGLQSLALQGQLDTTLCAAPKCTEANVFHRMGYETICFGPGEANVSPQNYLENVDTKDMEKVTHFYQHVIERFCS